jgi:hypothetical protein
MSWPELERRREELFHLLAPPILSAVGREDTPSPIFHGCFDWHSAVHGLYSLYAIHRRTGADLYLEAARQHSSPLLVAAELRYMQREAIEREENPYGFAWTFVLAQAEELAARERTLRPLADYGAQRVSAFVRGLDRGRALELATSDMHPNLSWALLHLALWARHTDDAGLLELARDAARIYLLDPILDDRIPVRDDTGAVLEFMAPGLMRLAALGVVLGEEAGPSIDERLPAGFEVPPYTDPTTVHGSGVNFFRAFALQHLAQATGRLELRDNVARLVLYQAERTDLWRAGDYDRRHWIAQIGVRVLDESYGD